MALRALFVFLSFLGAFGEDVETALVSDDVPARHSFARFRGHGKTEYKVKLADLVCSVFRAQSKATFGSLSKYLCPGLRL